VEMSASLWVAQGFAGTEKLELQKQSLAGADDRSYAELCRALGAYDATDRLAQISLPIFTVAGSQDQMCTVADSQQIANTVQNGTHAVLTPAAHLLPIEHPQRLAELLDENLG